MYDGYEAKHIVTTLSRIWFGFNAWVNQESFVHILRDWRDSEVPDLTLEGYQKWAQYGGGSEEERLKVHGEQRAISRITP